MIIRLLLLTVSLILSLPGQAAETLRVLTWPSYADSDLVKLFETKQDVRVDVSFVISDDLLREKIAANQGGDFDVFAANTAELQHYIDERLVVPLRLAHFPHTTHQLPHFCEVERIPGIERLGEVYAVPHTYPEMGLIFDRRQFKQPPTSLAAM